MEFWQNCISEGNYLYQTKKYEQAEQKYLQALESVKANFSQWQDPEMAIMSLLITYRNLSDSHLKQNQLKRAGMMLIQAHSLFKSIQQNVNSDSPWQAACDFGVDDIKSTILEFLEKYPMAGICQGCYQKIFAEDEVYNDLYVPSVIH